MRENLVVYFSKGVLATLIDTYVVAKKGLHTRFVLFLEFLKLTSFMMYCFSQF